MSQVADKLNKAEIALQGFARGHPFAWGLAVLLTGVALLVFRNPALLVDPQLYAEEGAVWYPNAYRLGLSAVWVPFVGYLNVLPHLVAWFCVRSLPLSYAPLAFHVAALLFQMLPVALLLSTRGESLVRQLWPRVAFSLVFLFLPSINETIGTLSSAQFNLALAAFLVLVLRPPQRPVTRVADVAILLLSGLSGPFCYLLLPIAVVMAVKERTRSSIAYLGILAACAVAQLDFILGMNAARATGPHGAAIDVLVRIVAMQLVLGPELGATGQWFLHGSVYWSNNILPMVALFVAGIAVLLACKEASMQLLLFGLFATLEMGAALLKPQISMTEAQWPIMEIPGAANRYYLYPVIAWTIVVFVLAGSAHVNRRIFGLLLLLPLLLFAIPSGAFLTRIPHTNFQELAAQFEASPSGTEFSFPISPAGWQMKLTKK